MKKHNCPRCGYSTNRISDFYNHFERKNPCKPKIKDIPFEKLYQIYYKDKLDIPKDINTDTCHIQDTANDLNNKKSICKFCGKKYSHNSSMYKHISLKHTNKTENKIENKPESKPESKIENALKKELESVKTDLKDLALNISPESKANRANVPSRLRGSNTKYVYLIREREFCRTNEDIYKIGKSCEAKYARLDKYPKWSEVISIMEVSDENEMEKIIIAEFQKLFVQTKYGNEYFEGDRLEIKKAFHTIVFNNDWNIIS